VAALVIMMLYTRKKIRQKNEWEIDFGELDMGDQIGIGAFGRVHKALWKGTEVAVKIMASETVSRDMERNFKEEVRVMTSLRHPNVVLFMAACTKPPRMCIVMEFMALGSMFDVRTLALTHA
jgi:serine/threonine protein kinase